MAIVYSETTLNLSSVDLNLAFRTAHTAQILAATFNKVLETQHINVGGSTVTIPGGQVSFNTAWTVQSDTGLAATVLAGTDFVSDTGAEHLTGGSASMILGKSDGSHIDFGIVGFSVPAVDFDSAAHSASLQDDAALFARILAGNDLFSAGFGKDRIDSGAGKDGIVSGGGNDRVNAGSGADLVMAGAGADTVIGGLGADILLGEAGSDRIFGGGGNDTIVGGAGNDILVGDGGADRFVFARGAGQDHIRGFTVGSDKIAIESGAANFAALTITQEGSDTVIRFGAVKITLDGIDDATVTATSFQFANALPHIGVAGAAAQQWLDGWNYLV